MYLLDTNIVIDFLRTRRGVGESLFERLVLARNDLAISTITISELYVGKSTLNTEKAKEINNLKSEGGLKIVNFTAAIAKLAGCVIRDSKSAFLLRMPRLLQQRYIKKCH